MSCRWYFVKFNKKAYKVVIVVPNLINQIQQTCDIYIYIYIYIYVYITYIIYIIYKYIYNMYIYIYIYKYVYIILFVKGFELLILTPLY